MDLSQGGPPAGRSPIRARVAYPPPPAGAPDRTRPPRHPSARHPARRCGQGTRARPRTPRPSPLGRSPSGSWCAAPASPSPPVPCAPSWRGATHGPPLGVRTNPAPEPVRQGARGGGGGGPAPRTKARQALPRLGGFRARSGPLRATASRPQGCRSPSYYDGEDGGKGARGRGSSAREASGTPLKSTASLRSAPLAPVRAPPFRGRVGRASTLTSPRPAPPLPHLPHLKR